MSEEDVFALTEDDIFALSEKLVLLATDKKLTFSFAESCTGGLISKSITDVSGASAVYPGGVCTYANSAKTKLLGVREETLRTFGAVSEQTAREMASGVRTLFSCDVGVAVTGIAGPSSDGTGKPVGLIYVCACSGKRTEVIKLTNKYTDSIRQSNRLSAAQTAILAAIKIIEVDFYEE